MINNNKKYDVREYNRSRYNQKAAARKRLATMQKIFMALLCISVTLGLVLLGIVVGKKANKDKDGTVIENGENNSEITGPEEITDLSSFSETT